VTARSEPEDEEKFEDFVFPDEIMTAEDRYMHTHIPTSICFCCILRYNIIMATVMTSTMLNMLAKKCY
jgi:hypothetical protein